ncbi:MAG: outer membrane lipoprotein chaperone LolA [Gammaproteobacteria bacterium]|nr:MAG: outer membrane lipoprotein chaperone LolA [Gammaproteobacteria bacterium]
MRRPATVLLLVLGAVSSAAGAGSASRVQDYLDDLTTLRAGFRQTVTDAQGRIVERAEGQLAVARPGRFRWDYRVPEQLIVSDGTTIWLYDRELEQVTVRAAGTALAGTPAMLLAGGVAVDQEFAVSDAGSADGLSWSRLQPRAEGDFREVRLGFSAAGLQRMQLTDRLGQVTELEFSALERNPPLDAGLFRFTPPPGVDVIGRAPDG